MRALFAEWPDRGRLWVRVRTVEKVLRAQDVVVFTSREDLARIPNPDLWALAEAWEEKINVGGSFHKYPDISVFPLGVGFAAAKAFKEAVLGKK